MKKQTVYIIIAILLLTVTVVGSTYAFLTSNALSNQDMLTNSSKFEIIFTGETEITGPINLSADRSGGLNTNVNIRLAEGSVSAKSNISLNIEKLSEALAVEGVIWEVVGKKNGTEVYYNSGNFIGYNTTTNNVVPLVENYYLSEDNTVFTIYFWINGELVDNTVYNAEFQGYINARSENFTANLG